MLIYHFVKIQRAALGQYGLPSHLIPRMWELEESLGFYKEKWRHREGRWRAQGHRTNRDEKQD